MWGKCFEIRKVKHTSGNAIIAAVIPMSMAHWSLVSGWTYLSLS